jgi:hypothetical protein
MLFRSYGLPKYCVLVCHAEEKEKFFVTLRDEQEIWDQEDTPEEQERSQRTKLYSAKETPLREEVEKQVELECVAVANILRYT